MKSGPWLSHESSGGSPQRTPIARHGNSREVCYNKLYRLRTHGNGWYKHRGRYSTATFRVVDYKFDFYASKYSEIFCAFEDKIKNACCNSKK